MPMTTLEASTTCLFHADSGLRDSSARKAFGAQTQTSTPVALSGTQSKFGGSSLDAYTASYGGVRFDGGGPFDDRVPISIECWAFFRSHKASNSTRIIGSQSTNNSANFGIRNDASGRPQVDFRDTFNNSNSIGSSAVLPLNQWVHLAATVDALRVRRLYVNGTLAAVSTSSIAGNGVPSGRASSFVVGGVGDSGGESPDAFIDEARYVFGQPVYEVPFVPPTVAFANGTAGDSLLLHGEGTNGGTTITDNSTNALTATQIGTAGSVTTSTVQKRIGSSSLRFAGQQAISYGSNALFEAASRNWTISCWVNLDTGITSGFRHIWQLFGASVDFRLNLYVDASTGQFRVFSSNGSGTGGDRIASGTLVNGNWHHTAVVKEGNAITLWIDGIPVGTVLNAVIPTGSLGLSIGTQNFSPVANDYWIGYVDELRAQMGTAAYTLQFTPPAVAYGDGPAPTPSFLRGALRRVVAAVPSVTPRFIDRLVKVRDLYYGGRGQIPGTVKEKSSPANLPLRRKVWLMRERDAVVIRETWSDAATGNYLFTGIDETQTYSVLTFDHLRNYRAVIADNLTPEVI